MRHRLSAGQSSEKYHAGQFVSAAYAARYPHKVSESLTRAEREARDKEEYESSLDDGDQYYEIELTGIYD